MILGWWFVLFLCRSNAPAIEFQVLDRFIGELVKK